MPIRTLSRLAAACAALGLAAAAAAEEARPDPARADNWGRWGADDERGAANLITPERIVEAARLVQRGKVISLAIPLDSSGPVFPPRLPPLRLMAMSGADVAAGEPASPAAAGLHIADDYVFMPLQGSTQWDALAHAWTGDRLYNGVPQTEVRGSGAARLGIENAKESLVGRGVLVDVLAAKGGELARGAAITRADLDAALARQQTRVRPGDIVLVRTGVVPGYYAIADPVERQRYVLAPQAGLALDTAGWVKEHDVAAIAADNLTLEFFPAQGETLHATLIPKLGVHIGEIWWLEELAADCARDGRYEFFLAAQPLHIPRGVGSPVNPVAIK
jgi:kynurenine formamidase